MSSSPAPFLGLGPPIQWRQIAAQETLEPWTGRRVRAIGGAGLPAYNNRNKEAKMLSPAADTVGAKRTDALLAGGEML